MPIKHETAAVAAPVAILVQVTHGCKSTRISSTATFFRKRRYVRYFVVQEEEQEQQHSNYNQRLAYHSYSLEALKREDSKAIDRIAEEASATVQAGSSGRDGTSTCRPTQTGSCFAYASRSPRDDEPELKQVVLAVEELVEQVVHGLSTLAIDMLRWLRSAKANEPDVRPLGRMQNKESRQRTARLWARLLCYCIRLVAAEEQQQEPQQKQQQERGLQSVAR
ncbi:hypothetical protein EK21DRAFT_116206 [Setomelanomma holmii]|uniref:Uncharacterized protein n=1 Tax=Setomelanomma holmii TaxID=210430 RepID=A0A9P4H197_9PLEO|nr:hypothetical protein EK21DRAFT_116206 [Setomelanomma holmii]